MAHEVVMPQLGLSMDSGRIVKWLREQGEWVKQGTILLEVESDKATVEVESPASGSLRIVKHAGEEEIRVGGVIAYLLREGEQAMVPAENLPPLGDVEEPRRDGATDALIPHGDRSVNAPASGQEHGARSSPRARRRAREMGVDWRVARATGIGGRVKERDVINLARRTKPSGAGDYKGGRTAPTLEDAAATTHEEFRVGGSGAEIGGSLTPRVATHPPTVPAGAAEGSEVIVQSHWQRIMAERMTESFTTAPHFYLHVDVDAQKLVALRGMLLPMMQDGYGIHLSYTDLLVRFCSLALARHPEMLAYWAGEGLGTFAEANVAVAVDTPRGLVAPVIRGAAKMSLADIARQLADVAERARAGKLAPRDLEGACFTLSNLGMLRIDSFSAILNPPQAAILAVGRIADRAARAEGGQIALVPSMSLTLTVDHRVLDGATAARFLSDLVEAIETPAIVIAW
jgi:pyruvate dehydrogenase E2 component (dihydrolipoamide acetyltransferase)